MIDVIRNFSIVGFWGVEVWFLKRMLTVVLNVVFEMFRYSTFGSLEPSGVQGL